MAIGIVFSGIAGATIPATTIIFGKMIDYFAEYQTGKIEKSFFINEVNRNALFFVYFAIIVFFATYIYMAAWVYTGERLTRQIRERYLRAVLRQNIAYFDKLGAGEVTTRITSDTHLIQDGISEKVSIAFSYVAQFVSAFVIAFTKSWKMTLVICVVIPLLSITTAILNKFTAKYMKRSLGYYSKSGTIAEEAISTIRTAVAFGIQSKLSKLYDSNLTLAKKEGIKRSILNGAGLGIVYFFIYSTYALAFWYGSTLILSGELTSGIVVNVFFAVLIGAFALANVAPELQAFSFATGAGSKIFETINRIPPIDIASESGEKLDNVEGRIQLKNISFIYPARPEVVTLKKLSLDIESGSTVALVGFSGSGKSTIVSLVLRFYDPVEGEVHLDGHNIKDLNLIWLRRQMSLVGQEPVLFNNTIAENVAHGLIGSIYENIEGNKKQIMIEQACRMANAHDFIINLPNKYETNVGERGFLLSGGQKQRIAIARAVIKDPKILLLDEATSALDTQSEGIVQDALDKASKNRTTIVIAHRLSTIKNATKIVVMNHGVIVEIGTHDELMSKKGNYYRLVEAQQIQQAKKVEAANGSLPPEDSDVLLTARKEDIIPEEDYTIGRVITNKSSSSAILAKRKDDLEAATKFDYEFTTKELIRKVAKINSPEISWITIGLFASIVCGIVYPIFAIIFSKIIQSFSKPADELQHDAKFWSMMFLVIAVIVMIASFVQGSSFGFSGENLTLRIRSMSFAAILRQDISFFDDESHNVGALTSALSLDATLVNGIAGVTFGTILQVSTTLVSVLIIAFIFGWKLTLVCLVCIPLLVGSGLLRITMLDGFQKKTKKSYEHSSQIACEGAGNIRTVAALTREENLWNVYHKLLDEPMKQGFKNAFFASITFAFAQFANGEYNLEKFFVVFMSIMFGSMSAGRVFAFAPDMLKGKSAAATIISLLERTPLIDTWSLNGRKLEEIEGNVKFTDVHFRYPTRPHIRVLKGLNIEVKPGQYAALVGPSGCGKSTTIGLTERFYETTGGKIEIDGIDITTMNVNNLREHIALVSQEPSLYDMSIKENILLGCKPNHNATQEDIERVCIESNIHDFIVSLPDGYDTFVGGKGSQLSGGQKQRIAIARALIRNPKILLLDEATSALDSESEKVVQKALDVAATGRTTLAIAHRLSTIQHADVIFVIKDGKVAEQGTHQELLAKNGIYFNMVQEQHLGANEE
ncbi:12008_t:CDS:10 [Funneliformis geosporum]|uniref:13563_t:CDS:1 n=1 Tax=Funneliformis geosporum TaxID=1117311 RepID=A0A9W4WND1_9GLOM|nr:12008_t:CDS:10 [Funneliformis geosporum]CAI2166699.1 13563_t:CDS:10 [Funneliformis geosporum]